MVCLQRPRKSNPETSFLIGQTCEERAWTNRENVNRTWTNTAVKHQAHQLLQEFSRLAKFAFLKWPPVGVFQLFMPFLVYAVLSLRAQQLAL